MIRLGQHTVGGLPPLVLCGQQNTCHCSTLNPNSQFSSPESLAKPSDCYFERLTTPFLPDFPPNVFPDDTYWLCTCPSHARGRRSFLPLVSLSSPLLHTAAISLSALFCTQRPCCPGPGDMSNPTVFPSQLREFDCYIPCLHLFRF